MAYSPLKLSTKFPSKTFVLNSDPSFFNYFNISRFHFRVNLTYLSSPMLPLETDEVHLAFSKLLSEIFLHFHLFCCVHIFGQMITI